MGSDLHRPQPELVPLPPKRYITSVGHILYRLYDDADQLLYIGITSGPLYQRLIGHARVQPWWDEVARCTTETHPTRKALTWAEWEAIDTERPRYNKSPGNLPMCPECGRRNRCELEAPGRDGLTECERIFLNGWRV